MALAFLPTEYIPGQFESIQHTNPQATINQLLVYFQEQLPENSTFLVSSYSVDGWPICTNNDVEGWHKWLNTMGHSQQPLNLYK